MNFKKIEKKNFTTNPKNFKNEKNPKKFENRKNFILENFENPKNFKNEKNFQILENSKNSKNSEISKKKVKNNFDISNFIKGDLETSIDLSKFKINLGKSEKLTFEENITPISFNTSKSFQTKNTIFDINLEFSKNSKFERNFEIGAKIGKLENNKILKSEKFFKDKKNEKNLDIFGYKKSKSKTLNDLILQDFDKRKKKKY